MTEPRAQATGQPATGQPATGQQASRAQAASTTSSYKQRRTIAYLRWVTIDPIPRLNPGPASFADSALALGSDSSALGSENPRRLRSNKTLRQMFLEKRQRTAPS